MGFNSGFKGLILMFCYCCGYYCQLDSLSLLCCTLIFTTFFLWRCDPTRVMASSFLRFLDHTQRRTTVGRTPLDEWSARRRDLYLTTHTTDKHPCPQWDSNPRSQQASGRRPLALDRAATGIGLGIYYKPVNYCDFTKQDRQIWTYIHATYEVWNKNHCDGDYTP